MKNIDLRDLNAIAGIGAGLLLMYIFDPQAGRRRRAVAKDKAIRLAHKTADAVEVASRDLTNRALGTAAEAWNLVTERAVSDEVLAERVRSKLGFLASHPGLIEAKAENGTVTLSGPVLRDEVDRLLRQVASIRGVESIVNRLEEHERPDSIPGLQGQSEPRPPGPVPDILQANWAPATRLLAGTAGATLAWYGARQRNVPGAALVVVTIGVIARALANMELKRLTGIGAGRRAVDVQKIINVSAPVHEVFSFWTNYENFPRFMSNVREVKETGPNRFHWMVSGPGGVPVEWDAFVTDYAPNQKVAWKTAPGSPVQHAGIVRFQENPDGSTRLDVRMSYNPVAGGLGHAVASLFGTDPKSEMDADLMRMKSLIETGVPPHDAARKNERIAYTH